MILMIVTELYIQFDCSRPGACPNDCSGHGICSLISDVSIFKGPDYDSTLALAGDGRGTEYTNWDKDSIQLCECDNGYFGSDCSIGKQHD